MFVLLPPVARMFRFCQLLWKDKYVLDRRFFFGFEHCGVIIGRGLISYRNRDGFSVGWISIGRFENVVLEWWNSFWGMVTIIYSQVVFSFFFFGLAFEVRKGLQAIGI